MGVRLSPSATAASSDAGPTVTTGSLSVGWQARTSTETPAWLTGELLVSELGWEVDVLGVKLAILPGRLSPYLEVAVGVGSADGVTRPVGTAGAGVDLLLGSFFVEAGGKLRLYRDAPQTVRTAAGVSQLTAGVGAGWLF